MMGGFFRKLFRVNPESPRTGIYQYSNNELSELKAIPGDGSINSIVQFIGFHPEQVRTIFPSDSVRIQCVGVKVFTSDLVYVIANDKNQNVTYPMVKRALEKVDWEFEYSEHFSDGILEDGISSGSFTLDFLKSVIKLEKQNNWLYLAPTLQVYLSFDQNMVLESYSSSEWAHPPTKWLKKINKGMFDGYYNEALLFHQEEIPAMEEVNLICQAIWNTPDAVRNKFVPIHTNSNGNINFYNLMAAHYNQKIHFDEFKIVNKGRYISVDENTLEVGKFIYQFDDDGFIIGSTMK